MTREKIVGLALGLVLGFVWVVWSFEDMFLVALAGLAGYLLAGFFAGQVDPSALSRRFGTRR